MTLRIASWNINSVRLRIAQVEHLAAAKAPDVICLQEIKTRESLFPALDCAEMGYPHQAVHGMKGYNGVAILSKHPLENIHGKNFCGREDARHIGATVKGIDVHSLYIPAGGDIPDATVNDKFAHKLAFFDEVTDWLSGLTRPTVLLGDFNVAPLDTDVWDHKKLKNIITHTATEIAKLDAMRRSQDWIDVARHVIPPEDRHFTWWSYRAKNWQEFNRGRRLDHIWITPDLEGRLENYASWEAPRSWDRPSDHIPIYMDLRP